MSFSASPSLKVFGPQNSGDFDHVMSVVVKRILVEQNRNFSIMIGDRLLCSKNDRLGDNYADLWDLMNGIMIWPGAGRFLG